MSVRTFVKYKISIVKVEEEEYTFREYKQIADTGNPKDNGKVYDYVPLQGHRVVETEVLKQESQDHRLNIVNVIKAVNGII